jgi:hypothetical protein
VRVWHLALYLQQVRESVDAEQVAPAQSKVSLIVSLTIEEYRQDLRVWHLAVVVCVGAGLQQVPESMAALQTAPSQ